VSDMFDVPWKTVENWLWINKMRRKWIAFALSLTIEDIMSSLPADYREHCMHVHKKYTGTPHALSMKALNLEQCIGEEQLVAHQVGGSKTHQGLWNNKKFLGAKVKKFVEVSRCSKHNHVLEWMYELLSDAWNNGKSLFIMFILLLLNSMLTFIRCAS